MIRPSDNHRMPDPLPRLPRGRTNTVERRRRSAISPSPAMPMLFALVFAFADDDADRAGRASAQEFGAKFLPDALAREMCLHIFEAQHWFSIQTHEDVSDHDSRLVRGARGFDFQHHNGAIRLTIERLHEILGKSNRLQTNTKVAARDASLLQQGIDDAIHRGHGQRQRAAWGKLWRGNADDLSVRIDHRATHSGTRQSDVKAHIRRQLRSAPNAPFLHYQADKSQRRHGATGASASD